MSQHAEQRAAEAPPTNHAVGPEARFAMYEWLKALGKIRAPKAP